MISINLLAKIDKKLLSFAQRLPYNKFGIWVRRKSFTLGYYVYVVRGKPID